MGRGVNRNLAAGSALALGRSPGAELELKRLSHPPRPPHRHHAPVPGEWGLGGSGPAVASSSRGPGSAVHSSGVGARACRRPSGLLVQFSSGLPLSPWVFAWVYIAVIQVPKTLGCL